MDATRQVHAKYPKLDAEVVNALVGAMQSLTERRLLCRLIPSGLASFPSTMHRSRCAHSHREGGAWPSGQIALGRGTQQAPSEPRAGPLPFAPPPAAGQTPPFPSIQVGSQAARRLACRTRPQGELGCQCGPRAGRQPPTPGRLGPTLETGRSSRGRRLQQGRQSPDPRARPAAPGTRDGRGPLRPPDAHGPAVACAVAQGSYVEYPTAPSLTRICNLAELEVGRY